jgi:hypothetical protein
VLADDGALESYPPAVKEGWVDARLASPVDKNRNHGSDKNGAMVLN